MSDRARTQILRQSAIFSGLTQDELGQLSSLAAERHVKSGEFIFWEGDEPGWFYMVAQGRVKVLKHSSLGRDFVIAYFGPGEMFGEVAVFEDKPYPGSAQAVDETTVLEIRGDDFRSYLADRPEIALRIINILAGRLRDAQSRLRDLAGERVEQRLARTLLMLHSKLGPTLPFTRQEIADMAGTTTETAIRFMSRLRDAGITRSARGKTVIINESRLRMLSEGQPAP